MRIAWDKQDEKLVENSVSDMLKVFGFDTTDPGFIDTPSRVMRFYRDFTQQAPPEIKVFPSCSTDMIQLNNFKTWGLCPHHLLPVKYDITIRYMPNGKVFGISKLPRVANYILRTMPLQEDLPKLIVDYLFELLDVQYAMSLVDGEHLCMIMRGVKADGCSLTTMYERWAEPEKENTCQVN